MNVIHCEEVTKRYYGEKALDNLSFSIQDHTITGLIGRNGAGKTTLMKLLSGFIQPESGNLLVYARKPFNNLAISANSIFIDDHMNWPVALSLGQLLMEGKRFYENWDQTLAERLFEYFSLRFHDIHKNLSKGKKSTFNLIFGLAARCPLTLLDEPMTGMDAAVRKDMSRVLLKEYLAFPRTILLSSHHMEEVEDLLEDVLLLDEGKTPLHLSMEDLREKTIGLTGHRSVLHSFVNDRKILHSSPLGKEEKYVVVERDFSEKEGEQMKQAGISISSVSPTNAAVYLTAKQERSIDDVLERD